MKSHKMSAREYFRQGIIHFQKQDYLQALDDFNQAIELRPAFGKAYYWRGETHSKLNLTQHAKEDYLTTIQLHPEFAHAYHHAGLAFILLNDPDSAITYLNKAIELDEKMLVSILARGEAHMRLKEHQSAIMDFNYFIEKRSEKTSLHLIALAHENIGNICSIYQQHEFAIAHYIESIKLYPSFREKISGRLANAYLQFGKLQARKFMYDHAIEYFSTAIHYNPNLAEAYKERGKMYRHKANQDFNIADTLGMKNTAGNSTHETPVAYPSRMKNSDQIMFFSGKTSKNNQDTKNTVDENLNQERKLEPQNF